MRRLLQQIHEKSPERAKEAIEFYVKRMTQLLQDNCTSSVVEAEDANVRLEYAHESVRLPTGHVVSVLPRVHFNYLPENVFEEMKVS